MLPPALALQVAELSAELAAERQRGLNATAAAAAAAAAGAGVEAPTEVAAQLAEAQRALAALHVERDEQLAAERERRERAALRADAEFSTEFLNAARKVFQMIDDDGSGTLEKAEMSARSVRPSTCARRGGGRSSRP